MTLQSINHIVTFIFYFFKREREGETDLNYLGTNSLGYTTQDLDLECLLSMQRSVTIVATRVCCLSIGSCTSTIVLQRWYTIQYKIARCIECWYNTKVHIDLVLVKVRQLGTGLHANRLMVRFGTRLYRTVPSPSQQNKEGEREKEREGKRKREKKRK